MQIVFKLWGKNLLDRVYLCFVRAIFESNSYQGTVGAQYSYQ